MLKKEFTLVSDFDGLELKGVVYEPETPPKGIVQVVHGMCEYKNYYENVMEFFAKNGYIAAAHDHRGHGQSVKKEEDHGWFHDRNGKAVVEDCVQVTKYLRAEYPSLPLTLFGHSMGSMVVRCYIREHDDLIDKLIVCGSPASNPLAGVAVFLAKCVGAVKGERHRSKLLKTLSTGKASADFEKKKGGSWLTRDQSLAEKKKADPWCEFTFTANGFENLFNLMKFTYTKKGYCVQNSTLPIHFVSGSEDIMLGDELQWFKSVEFLRGVGYERVTGKLYKGMRHELHNEFGKEEFFNDLLRFIET